MGIIMAGLSPHPPLIIPEIGGSRREEVSTTIKSLEELSREVVEKKPDLLITISPHGPVFTDAISILDLDELEGNFEDFGCPGVHLKAKSNPVFIRKLAENSQVNDIEVITLSSADLENYNYPPRLDHGVLVPLYFLQEVGFDVPIVPITMGLLGYHKLYHFGKVIQKTLEDEGIEAIIIASGDLSHRLKPGAPAGFNPHGKEFDEKLINLLKKGKYRKILDIDPVLIEKAGECGLRPIIIMLGSIEGLNFKAELKSYEGPFGVGYGVIGFYPVS